MKKLLIVVSIAAVIVGGLVVALLLAPPAQSPPMADANPAESTQTADEVDAPEAATDLPLAAGRYTDYSADAVAVAGYDTTVLFFHASWCPECRAFEQAINDSTIPGGVQILKVDYDSSVDLRQEYGVTLQSTFVSVTDDGTEVSQWVGYGKDKSVEAILENL